MRVEGERGVEQVWCPECGKKMDADLHGPFEMWAGLPDSELTKEAEEKRMQMDGWICSNVSEHDDHELVALDREDVEARSA